MIYSLRHHLATAAQVAATILFACSGLLIGDPDETCRLGGPAYEDGHHACR